MTRPHNAEGTFDHPAQPAAQAFGLTKRQSLFWVERKLAPAVPLHNTALTIELIGALDTERLDAAYREMVARLDFLRLFVDDAEPRQWVVDEPAPPLERLDLSESPERFDTWVAERSLQPFSFPGWLFSPVLVRLAPRRHVFYLLLHHIVSDGTSAMRLVDYFADLYAGRVPKLRPSFRDYAEFEAAYRESPKQAKDAAYWLQKIGTGVPPLRFYGRSRTLRSVALERIWHDFGPERRTRFEALVAREEFQLLTPQMSRLAVLSTVLFAFVNRVTENRELVIATPLENRAAQFQDTFGLLMEQAFLKVEIEEGETFSTLFEKVRKDLGRTFRHGQHCVSERGLDFVSLNLMTRRVGSFADLECHVRLQSALTQGGALHGMEAGLKNTLGIQIHDAESSDRLVVGFDLHAETLSTKQRGRLIEHFEHLLDALLEAPDQPIGGVDLVGTAERSQVLAHARGSDPPAPPDLIDRFAEQSALRAGKVAVEAGDGRLSYGELSARVNRLARRFGELGIGPESRVGVSLARGANELTTLLAILVAGGAYVPLDPVQPLERLRLILEDAAPELLVTSAGMSLAGESEKVPRVFIEDEIAGLARFDATPPNLVGRPDQLAYILFTSGSTGRPKGVEITRGAFANFLSSMAHTPGLDETARLLAVTTTMFDIAGLELFLPLWVGATVQIADAKTSLDPRRLRAELERGLVTVLQATPATWRMLTEAGWRGDKRLRMFAGGEALSRELATELIGRGGELWNLYGPTETTVWSTLSRVAHEGEIVIGRPIDRTQIYVLDTGGHLAPHGVAGELCIGGAGLARGYRGRPELTAERFAANPYGPPGDRLYRTGDLGRLRDDGTFECLGRLDQQVKIRGFRIELGEIEVRLGELPEVLQAVVVVREERAGDPRLVAYVRPAPNERLDTRLIARALRSRLPSYMLPQHYVCLEAFPLTPNGKIDRRALPAPDLSAPDANERERSVPRNATQRTLLDIWTKALGTEKIGIDDDFFELGGHSLLAVKIFDRIHRSFGVDLPLATLFEAPTIAALAERLDELSSGRTHTARWTTVVPVQPNGFLPPLFCVAGLGGNPMNLAHLAVALGEEQPFYGLQYRGVDGKLEPHTSISGMAEEFLTHVQEAQPRGPYYLAGYSAGGLAAYEMARMLVARGERVAVLILLDTFNPATPKWSPRERLQAHLDNLFERGVSYVPNRLRDRVLRTISDAQRTLGASLARREPFRFRHEALAEAGRAAERVYRPQPYGGDVLILQADARLSAGDGIGYRPHESNGWRGCLTGKLEVVQVACSHLDVVSDKAAPLTAAEVRRVLTRVRQQFEPRDGVTAADSGPQSDAPDHAGA